MYEKAKMNKNQATVSKTMYFFHVI